MKKIRDPGSPRVGGFWPWESLLSRILSGSRLEPWLEPLTLPCGGTRVFFDFFHCFDFFDFFSKNQKKFKKSFFLIFSKRPKNEKNQKNQKNEKHPGPWVSPRGGFLAVGIPPLPDPEWLQAGALAGALDSPCGGTLDFFDFFHCFDFFDFFEKPKKSKKNQFFLIFLIFFEKAKKRKKSKT